MSLINSITDIYKLSSRYENENWLKKEDEPDYTVYFLIATAERYYSDVLDHLGQPLESMKYYLDKFSARAPVEMTLKFIEHYPR